MLGNMCTEELVYFDLILQEGVLENVKFLCCIHNFLVLSLCKLKTACTYKCTRPRTCSDVSAAPFRKVH